MKKQMNNKGFSLVELIVVMAIMAILAVTLAPKLTQYIEKSKRASDQEVVNTIFTAVKYACIDENIYTKYVKGTVDTDLTDGLNSGEVAFDYDKTGGLDILDSIYIGSTGSFNAKTFTGSDKDLYFNEIKTVVGNSIKLKSKLAESADTATIKVLIESSTDVTVTLDYNGDTYVEGDGYQITSK